MEIGAPRGDTLANQEARFLALYDRHWRVEFGENLVTISRQQVLFDIAACRSFFVASCTNTGRAYSRQTR
ncbi:MAG TPA: hypothetical protein VGM82_00330 [Gemmatimonadaceae bacterium]